MARKRLAVKKDFPVQVMMTREEVERMDAVCEALEITRSDFIRVGIEHNFEDWRFLERFGVTAQKINKIASVLKKFGFKSSDIEGE